MQAFPFIAQSENKDCGPTCLKMICKYYGRDYSISYLKELVKITTDGTTLYNLQQAAIKLGFESYGARLSIDQLFESITLPCIAHWGKAHYVVIIPGSNKNNILIADPGNSIQNISIDYFKLLWFDNKSHEEGHILVLNPKPQIKSDKHKLSKLRHYLNYFKPHKTKLLTLLAIVLLSGFFSFLMPKISRDIIDKGIGKRSIDAVKLLLIAQFSLLVGSIILDAFRSWLILKINNRFTLSVLTDFLIKITKLPIAYFDTKKTGDIQQRIYDHNRIQSFIITNSSTLLVSTITFIALFSSLLSFSSKVLLIILLFGVIKFFVIRFFLTKRKELDYAQFYNQGNNQDNIYEILNGIQDIKLHNCEDEKIDKWHKTQTNILNLNVRGFRLGQKQNILTGLLSNIESITVSFITAYDVIIGTISLGTMVSINLVTGQLKSTIFQYTNLLKSYQDAQISIERLEEIQNIENEDETLKHDSNSLGSVESIEIANLCFKYDETKDQVLRNINLSIYKGDTIAIVGSSGCGKTTLLKLLLKYYKPSKGRIIINNAIDLNTIPSKQWRNLCGIVMQDGYIFADTIKTNIILHKEVFDEKLFEKVTNLVNLTGWIENLPLKHDTLIGRNGRVISGGQKQRILIARAIYKDPDILLFDEATSSLDVENELQIIDKIPIAFPDKIKLIIAHRFSTIKNANKIIVIDKGEIVEAGTHKELMNSNGLYQRLVSNQVNVTY